jgi:hypothetical protein
LHLKIAKVDMPLSDRSAQAHGNSLTEERGA